MECEEDSYNDDDVDDDDDDDVDINDRHDNSGDV